MSVVYMESLHFFFSSRRRHTRLQGDWSSDVCSSDLSRHNYSNESLTARQGHVKSSVMTVCPAFADSSLPTRGETGPTFSRNGLDAQSFVTQGDDRVHAHGAARGDVAGNQSNARQQNGDTCERYWIGRAD